MFRIHSFAIFAAALGGLALASAGDASAGTITQTLSITTATTNWNQNLAFNQFDSSLGTLNSVTYSFSGSVGGTAQAENQDASPATIDLSLEAQMKAERPGTSTVVSQIFPLASFTFNAAAYDGTLDYGGTSGITLTDLTGSDSISNTISTSLADFIGTGTVSVPVFASGLSSANGGGNTTSHFTTQAGASLTITYDYTAPPSVPEPMSILLLGVGVTGIGLVRRRRTRL